MTTLYRRRGPMWTLARGGVATASYMASIGNRYLLASGRRVVHGFAGEFVDRLVSAGSDLGYVQTAAADSVAELRRRELM